MKFTKLIKASNKDEYFEQNLSILKSSIQNAIKLLESNKDIDSALDELEKADSCAYKIDGYVTTVLDILRNVPKTK